jgi:hypothetical protein
MVSAVAANTKDGQRAAGEREMLARASAQATERDWLVRTRHKKIVQNSAAMVRCHAQISIY